MIRYKNEVFEDYFIDPITAVITDKDGNAVIQKTSCGRAYVMICGDKMMVHQIQAHTAWEYVKGYDVHHIDEDKTNNALSNLMYLTRKEHTRIHSTGKHINVTEESKEKNRISHLGKRHTEETKEKMRMSSKHSRHLLGTHRSEEVKQRISEKLTGRKLSEETKRKLSEARLRYLNGLKK